MQAKLTAITEGVKTLLAAASLSQTFTAIRVYAPVYDSAKDTSLKVFIQAGSQTPDLTTATRAEIGKTYTVAIGIFKTVDAESTGQPNVSTCDDLSFFVEQVVDVLTANRSVGVGELVRITVPATADVQNLKEHSVFVSTITAEYTTL